VRTLVLIRHSKAEPQSADDHGRHLSERGGADAGLVRRWLEAQGLRPDRVVVSSATRTRETWEHAGVGTVEPEYDDRVYEASVTDLREVVAETEPSVEVLVVVGHNPGIERFAWELDDSDGARDRTNGGMRTSGVAVFELDGWDSPEGRLVAWEA
jgi:phosphohistidine phosphatase